MTDPDRRDPRLDSSIGCMQLADETLNSRVAYRGIPTADELADIQNTLDALVYAVLALTQATRGR